MPLFAPAAGLQRAPQPGDASGERETIGRVMEWINQSRFDSVLAVSQRLINDAPGSPIGYFLAADAWQTLMRDFRVKSHQALFDSLIKIADARASARLHNEMSAENLFYAGTVQGYYCLALFQAGHYLRALKTVENSIALMRKAHRMEPDFADPLFGIAAYEYHKSKLLFGLLGGSEKEAVAKFRQVEQRGRYLATNARYSLQAIYYENGQYDSALVINEYLYRHYPASPSCLYTRALLLEKTGRLAEAFAVWNQLTGVLTSRQPASNGFLAECHYHLAWIHHQLGEDAAAWKVLIEAAQFAARRRAEEELEGSITKFNEIKKRINAALQAWPH